MKRTLLSLVLIVLSIPSFAHFAKSKEYPEARRFHTMVEIDGKIYMFGGESSSKGDTLNELWEFDKGNMTWTEENPSNPPEPRKNHTAVALNGKMYVHGGETENGVTMDMWVYDPQSNSWTKLSPSNAPGDKLFQRAVASEGQIFVTGGWDMATGEASAETWAYNPNYNTWTRKADMPFGRYGHASFFRDLKVYVTCGKSGDEFLNDTYVYDIPQDSWSQQTTNGNPTPVKFSSYISGEEMLLMTGGICWDGLNHIECADTWEYRVTNNTWTKKEDGPAVAFGAGVITSDNKSDEYVGIFFGGSRGNEILGETWYYYSTSGWSMLGIDDTETTSKGITIYPSSSSGVFHIKSKEAIHFVSVFDMSGKTVWQSGQIDEPEINIDLQNNPNGMYVVHLQSKKQTFSKKIQVVK